MLGAWLAGVILAAEPAAPGAPPIASTPASVVGKAASARPQANDPTVLVCHSEQIPGSRLSTRVCMTAADAARRRQQDQRDLSSAQMQPVRPSGDMMMMGPR